MKVDSDMHVFFANRLQEKIIDFGTKRMDAYLAQLDQLNKYITEKCEINEEKWGVIFKTQEK